MRKHVLLPAILAAVGSLVAAAPAGAARASHHRAQVIRLIEHADTDATTDTGAPGDSAGDVLTFANPIFDSANAKRVATDQGYCIRVVVGSAYECTWTTFLKGGQVVVQGPFYDAKDSTLAVTGGTGRYQRVRGSMRLHARAGGTSYDFVFRLLR
jgi:allene oxide cyclase